jgi:hypothetical protein
MREKPEETREDVCHVCGCDLDTSRKQQMIGPDYRAWCPLCEEWRVPIVVLNEAASKLVKDILEEPAQRVMKRAGS